MPGVSGSVSLQALASSQADVTTVANRSLSFNSSLAFKCHQWIDTCGAPRWEVTGEQSNNGEEDAYEQEGLRVAPRDAIQEASNQPCQHERSYDSQRKSAQDQRQTLTEYQTKDAAPRRSERDPHTHFVGPL